MDGLQYTSQQKRRKEKEIPPQNFIIQEELGFFYWNVTIILGLLNKPKLFRLLLTSDENFILGPELESFV